MKANRYLLIHKYVRVVEQFSVMAGITLREALEHFYKSQTFYEIEHGISDMHCRSDGYLAEELLMEMRAQLLCPMLHPHYV
jgi:hypothetical protein